MSENLTVFGNPVDDRALEQIKNCMTHPAAAQGALMADHHLGYSMPIGGVVAYQDAVSPSGVGYDIGCGNKCVKTNLFLSDLPEVRPIMRAIQKKVEFGMGRSNDNRVEHSLFDDGLWTAINVVSGGNHTLYQKAKAQLGTVGAGNHYVDLLVGSDGAIWVACHFGSRGFGHTIANGFMNLDANLEWSLSDKKRAQIVDPEQPVVISADSELGAFYIQAMRLAGEYAYAGRDAVIQDVLTILGAHSIFTVHNHHNYAWLENGRWVVRKGATPLTSEPAFIGGSMGEASMIVSGTGKDLGNIDSAPHGAGRQMSRTKAAGKLRNMWACNGRDCNYAVRKLNPQHLDGEGSVEKPSVCPACGGKRFSKLRLPDKSTAAIDWTAVRQELSERGIVVLGAGADEAPAAYKSLAAVIDIHTNIDVLERLEPVGVVMAGPDELDPWRD